MTSLPRLLQLNSPAYANAHQLVTPLTMRANEVDPKAVDARIDLGMRDIGFAADAFPHGSLRRHFLGIVA
jgi:hypothetical protein